MKETVQAPAWRRVNYSEWVEQAKLAAAGDTAGLQALQAELFSRGRDNVALIAGVGEKTAAALSAAGITTYAALADSSPERLSEITKAAGVRAGCARGGRARGSRGGAQGQCGVLELEQAGPL